MRGASFLFLLALACASPLACSSGSSPSDALESFAQQYCASFMPCCGGEDAGAPDPDTCVQTVTSWKQFGFDPSLSSACLTAMKQAAGTADFCSSLGAAQAPCDAVFSSVPSSGATPPGGACTSSDACAAPPGGGVAVCRPPASSPGATTGNCYQVLPGKPGEGPCYSEQYGGITSSNGSGPAPYKSYTCHDYDGVYCDFATHTCEPFLAAGAACDPNGDDCGPYAYCGGAGAVTQCVADLEAGAPCDPSATATFEAQCDYRTTRCRAATRTCTPFLPSGSPCTADDECAGACKGGKCATPAEAQLCDTAAPSFHPQAGATRP